VITEQEELIEVLRNSRLLATTDLQDTLQAVYEFKSHETSMVNNMDVPEEQLLRKIQEGN